jgi:hypothetical protein
VSPHNSQTLFSIHFYLALCVINARRCHTCPACSDFIRRNVTLAL